MNIMIINHYAGSDQYGMEFRPLYMGRELVKQGHDVTVIAADHSHLRKQNPVVQSDFEEQVIDGVTYVWVKTPPYTSNNHKRLFNVMTFYRKVKKNTDMLSKKYRPDAVVGSSTYPNDVILAKAIAQKSRAKTAYEIHDIWPLSIMELYGFGEKNPIIKIIQKAEHFAYQNSDVVISILPDADKHIKELGYENINYVKIPNGVVLDSEREMIPQVQHELLDGYRKQDKFIVMYLGGFATANALEDLLDCSLLLPENAQIVMVGDGVLKKDFEQRIKDNEYQNITILPSVKKREVQDILSYADCLYIGAKECSLYRYGVGMNKIFDYMLAKKPIIYGVKASNDPIKDADCGITIQPESSSEIAKAICDLMDLSKERLDQMGENGYNYVVKNHDYKVLAEKFANALK